MDEVKNVEMEAEEVNLNLVNLPEEASCSQFSGETETTGAVAETSTSSTNLTQDMLEMEVATESSNPPDRNNGQQPIEEVEAEWLDGEVEIEGDSDDLDYCEDFECMSPLIYSRRSSHPIEGDEEMVSDCAQDLEAHSSTRNDEASNTQGSAKGTGVVQQCIAPPKKRTLPKPFEFHGNVHPLLIPNVLRDIFNRFSSPDDLRNCRLVCSAWNKEACEVLQKRYVVTFLDNHSITAYLEAFPCCQQYHPHTKYQFYNIEFNDSNQLLNQFFIEFGPTIKSLVIQIMELTLQQLYNILRNHAVNLQSLWLRSIPLHQSDLEDSGEASGSARVFPKVQNLTIGTRDFGLTNNGPLPKIRESFAKLLLLFPNLRRISFSRLDQLCTSLHSVNFLGGVVGVGPNRLKSLTSLGLPMEADEELLVGLISLQCPYLNDIDLTLTDGINSKTFAQFFNMVGANLTNLSLSFLKTYPSFQPVRLSGQDIRRVTKLKLNRFRWSLEFLEHMLLLDKLTLKDIDVGSVFPCAMKTEIKLRALKIYTEDAEIPNVDVRILGKMTRSFPWLKVLHIPGLTDEGLRVIYFDLPCLTSLECVKGEFTEYGVTGVINEVCKDLAETTTYLVVNADKLRTNLFIGNLTNLQHLKLESDSIGDLSILFGVCKCLKLDWLYLKSPNITDIAVEVLADQFGHSLKYFNIANCPGVTEAGKFYFNESLQVRKVLVDVEPTPNSDHGHERVTLSRYHRYCDTFVRRRYTSTRASGEDLANSWVIHRNPLYVLRGVAPLHPQDNPDQALAQLDEVDEHGFQIGMQDEAYQGLQGQPINLELQYVRSCPAGRDNILDRSQNCIGQHCHNPILDQFLGDWFP